jgi:hypothetical protein
MPKAIVVVIRDPDFSNEYHTFGDVVYHDIDCGYMDLNSENEAWMWATNHLRDAMEFADEGHRDVAALIRTTVENYVGETIDIDAAVGEAAAEFAMAKQERSNSGI